MDADLARFNDAWRARVVQQYEFWYLQREILTLSRRMPGECIIGLRLVPSIAPKPLHTVFVVP